MKKIGILAGTFDPVHGGHINFALGAIKACNLEKVYLLPERQPRAKKNVTAFNHRLAMLDLAVKKHERLAVLELPEKQFTISKTLPWLRSWFAPRQTIFLLGSDVAAGLGGWPGLSPLIIGLRQNDDKQEIEELFNSLGSSPPPIFINSPSPAAASSQVRGNNQSSVLDPAVRAYINQHRLYA